MRRLSFLYLALVLVLASGCATAPSQSGGYSAEQLKNLGEKALMAHDTGASLQYLTAAEHMRPDNPSIQYDLALAYNQRGFKAQALQHIKRALKIKPDYPAALNTLGYMYATSGKFDLARAAFLKALNNPFYQTPQIPAFNLGRLYEDRGDYRNALSYYRQAVKLSSQYAPAWYRIGRILERTGKTDEARSAYHTALRASPGMAKAHLRLGIMSYRAGDFRDAAGSFAQVEQIAPGSHLANVAKKYLERINNPEPAGRRFRYRPSSMKIKRPELTPSAARSGNSYAKTAASGGANGAQQAKAGAVQKSGAWRFIVSIGAFAGRAKAEGVKSSLDAKGFTAVVRRARGRAFVVELKPVDTFSQASTLMTQVVEESQYRPRILRVRAR